MEKNKLMREPKQKRSAKTRENILNAALQLFCKKGYYKTTTNEIAKVANVSIGNLYFYFKDKDIIFSEILNRYNQSFLDIHEKFTSTMDNYCMDRKAWLKKLLNSIIEIHENSIEFNKEIHMLSFSKPEVAEMLENQKKQILQTIMNYFQKSKSEIKVDDIEAASVVAYTMLGSIVDQVVFYQNKINSERILNEAVNAIDKYLFL